jgi:serine phosphatase RsbU (regulator of sigma subunit)
MARGSERAAGAARAARRGGMSLASRFALSMTLALSVVMALAGWQMHASAKKLVRRGHEELLFSAAKLTADQPSYEIAGPTQLNASTNATRTPIELADGRQAALYGADALAHPEIGRVEILAPLEARQDTGGMPGLIVTVVASVVVIGAAVALIVGRSTAEPIERLVEDVRQLARGNLRHHPTVHVGGEVGRLAASIEHMARELDRAQEAALELRVRERETELAAGVREALLPARVPELAGFEIAVARIASQSLGGDFHEFVEVEDGGLALVACEVSGTGMPAALVGATARSYVRGELGRGGDLGAALGRVNRDLARDVRRGMYATAAVVRAQPDAGRVELASAGHALPVLVSRGADGKLRAVHGEGIALGLDRGPVFERALAVETLELAPGDRIVIASSRAAKLANPDGEALGDKRLFALIQAAGALPLGEALESARAQLAAWAGDAAPAWDVYLMGLARRG